MKFKKTIAIVDDESLFRDGFKLLFKSYKHLDVIIESESGKDLMEKLKVQQPDVVIIDIEMPGMNGVEITEAIRKRYPKLKIIVLGSYKTRELMFCLIEKGANAFLCKNTAIKIVIKAIDEVIEKGYYYNYERTHEMVAGILELNKTKQNFVQSKLSGRELEVIKLICKEHTNKEIADILCLSCRTIDSYKESIFQKTGARNSVGVAFYAIKHKLFDPIELNQSFNSQQQAYIN